MSSLLIVGGGPAGLSAAIAAKMAGVESVTILAPEFGGRYQSSRRIENVLGWPLGCDGTTLAQNGVEQARRLGVRMWNAQVLRLRRDPLHLTNWLAVVQANDAGAGEATAVVLAHGMTMTAPPKELPSYENGEPVVVGGGDAAGQAALHHAGNGRRVHLVVRRPALTEMSSYLRDRIEQTPLVCVHLGSEVGDVAPTSVALTNGTTIERPECAWLIGASPNNEWTGALLDSRGFILTDSEFRTSLPGVWAVGDTRSGSIKRIAVAAGEGMSAGVRAAAWLARTNRQWPTLTLENAA